MEFNDHYNLKDLHAFLSPSKYHWTRYSEEKIIETYKKFIAVQRGTELHDFARRCIELRQRLPKLNKSLNMFVNDAIGFRMVPEQPLYYSLNAFGTCDAISFRDKILRIHDLKTGVTATSMRQLEVYAALFCLEYKKKPKDLTIILRIYQNDEIVEYSPDPNSVLEIMEKIVIFDKKLEQYKAEEEE